MMPSRGGAKVCGKRPEGSEQEITPGARKEALFEATGRHSDSDKHLTSLNLVIVMEG
jgi:hypothetical protein